ERIPARIHRGQGQGRLLHRPQGPAGAQNPGCPDGREHERNCRKGPQKRVGADDGPGYEKRLDTYIATCYYIDKTPTQIGGLTTCIWTGFTPSCRRQDSSPLSRPAGIAQDTASMPRPSSPLSALCATSSISAAAPPGRCYFWTGPRKPPVPPSARRGYRPK